jgi:hypothetical protein
VAEVGEEAHKEVHEAADRTNGQRSRGMPVSRAIVIGTERLEREAALESQRARRPRPAIQGVSSRPLGPSFDTTSFPLPAGALRDQFEQHLANLHTGGNIVSVRLLSLTQHLSGTSLSGRRVEAPRDDVLLAASDEEPQQYFRLFNLFKLSGVGYALGQRMSHAREPDAQFNAYAQCRSLPYSAHEFSVVHFSRVVRPVNSYPDFSTCPMTRERLPRYQEREPTQWFIHDKWSPREEFLPAASKRLERAVAMWKKAPSSHEAPQPSAPASTPLSGGETERHEPRPSTLDADDLHSLLAQAAVVPEADALVRELRDIDKELEELGAGEEAFARLLEEDELGSRHRRAPERHSDYVNLREIAEEELGEGDGGGDFEL